MKDVSAKTHVLEKESRQGSPSSFTITPGTFLLFISLALLHMWDIILVQIYCNKISSTLLRLINIFLLRLTTFLTYSCEDTLGLVCKIRKSTSLVYVETRVCRLRERRALFPLSIVNINNVQRDDIPHVRWSISSPLYKDHRRPSEVSCIFWFMLHA